MDTKDYIKKHSLAPHPEGGWLHRADYLRPLHSHGASRNVQRKVENVFRDQDPLNIMAITSDRLRQTFSEGGAQEIYLEIKSGGDFLGFAKQYAFDADYRVARSALWGLTKACDKELSQLQVLLDELINQALHTENSSVRRLTLNVIERLALTEDNIRADFLDFCLEHMVAGDEFPGVQTLCMKLAYRMCNFYPELKEEFMRIVDAMEIEYYKPAVKGLRAKILSGKYQ